MVKLIRRLVIGATALLPCACSLLLDDGLSDGDGPTMVPEAGRDASDGNASDADAAPGTDADAASRGLRFRAASKATVSVNAPSFVLEKPAGTVAGDLLWVVQAGSWDREITPPSGFKEVLRDFHDTCGPPGEGGWQLSIFAHVATATEPASYTFTAYRFERHSAIMLALDGADPNGWPVVSDGARHISANPFAPPSISTPPEDTYALATFTARFAGDFTTPPSATSLTASSALALFSRAAPAGQSFDFGPSTSTPDVCGLAHVALIRLR